MKLALVIYGDLDQTTGGYLYDRELLNHLERAGDTVHVISLKDRGYLRNILPEDRKTIIRKLSKQSYDAIIFDELCHPALLGVLPAVRHKTCCIGLVHHLRSSEPSGFASMHLAALLEKQFLANMHGLICNSETTARACQSLLKRQSPKVIARPGPITHLAAFTARDISQRLACDGPLRILFLGTLTERKGLHWLLQALEKVTKPVYLAAVGSTSRDPRYARACKSHLAKLTRHHINIAGEISQDELTNRLSESDILVVPSAYEGFGIAYIEGFSAGLPCIATTKGAPPEFITHGSNGFLVAPGDIDAIASHIETLAADRTLLKKMSLDSLESFSAHSNWDENFSELRTFISSQVAAFHSGHV